MPNWGSWYVENRLAVLPASERAVYCWNRIQDRPTSIVINRDGTGDLAAQTVRIEYGETSDPHRGEVAGSSVRDVWVIGVQDHPDASVLDTDIRARDRFALNYETYIVVDVIAVPGEAQARCERVS